MNNLWVLINFQKIYIVRIFTEQQTKLLIEARYNCTYNQLTKWTNQTNKGTSSSLSLSLSLCAIMDFRMPKNLHKLSLPQ